MNRALVFEWHKRFSTLQIGSVAFPTGQCTSPQFHSCHRLFDQDGHQDSSSASYSTDLAPCDLWLFPKLGACRYETIEEMKEAVTNLIDTLTQEHFHGDCWTVQQVHCSGGDNFEGDYSFICVLLIKSAHTKTVWKLI